jgi:hypothetical protein
MWHYIARPGQRGYNADRPLTRAIMTGGTDDDLHPDGHRGFNLQELALLAGFLATHKFCGTASAIKRQVGNAVPSCVAKAIFQSVIKSLKETDGVTDEGGINHDVEMRDALEEHRGAAKSARKNLKPETVVIDDAWDEDWIEVKAEGAHRHRQPPIRVEDDDVIVLDT